MTPETLTLWISAVIRHAVIPLAGLGILLYAVVTHSTGDETLVGLGVGLLTGGIISSTPASAPEGSTDGLPVAPLSDGSPDTSKKRSKQ